jgi:hypothetical protein
LADLFIGECLLPAGCGQRSRDPFRPRANN